MLSYLNFKIRKQYRNSLEYLNINYEKKELTQDKCPEPTAWSIPSKRRTNVIR